MNLYYNVHKGNKHPRQPIVIMHGLLGTGKNFDGLAKQLVRITGRTVSFILSALSIEVAVYVFTSLTEERIMYGPEHLINLVNLWSIGGITLVWLISSAGSLQNVVSLKGERPLMYPSRKFT